MASAPGSGAAPPAPAVARGGVADDSPADRWDALKLAEATARAERASASLAARVPEDGVDPSRPVPPALPSDVWALIMDFASSWCVGVTFMEGAVAELL